MKQNKLKGTKQIRQITIQGREYFVYDLDLDKEGRRKRIYGKTREELESKLKEISVSETLNDIEDGITLDKFITIYCDEVSLTYTQRETFRNHQKVIEASNLSNISIKDLNPNDINKFLEDLSYSRISHSIIEINKMIKELISYAITREIINDFDFSKIVIPSKDNVKNKDFTLDLSKEDLQKIRRELKRKNLHNNEYKYGRSAIAILLFTETSLKLNDIKYLKWKNIKPYNPQEIISEEINEKGIAIQKKTLVYDGGIIVEDKLSNKYLEEKLVFSKDLYETLMLMKNTLIENGSEDINLIDEEPIFKTKGKEIIDNSAIQKLLRSIMFVCGLADNITTTEYKSAVTKVDYEITLDGFTTFVMNLELSNHNKQHLIEYATRLQSFVK